jgi:diadenosine tetraphosphate (Ap4A) HIT family hydrolase
MTDFKLDSRIENDTVFIQDLALSRYLLMKNATWVWCLLVPRKPDLTEIIDLEPQEQAQLMEEITSVSKHIKTVTGCDKLNVGALGNQVAQLHVHVIARSKTDPAWPNPVWGSGFDKSYQPDELQSPCHKAETR